MIRKLKWFLENMPIIGRAFTSVRQQLRRLRFRNSAYYWERRYQKGRTSGPGSYSRSAEFKAEVLNLFVREKEIRSVIEFGCGDGHQLSLAEYPSYIGIDVSQTAVQLCRKEFSNDPTKQIFHSSELNDGKDFHADLAISIEVIFHLTEDDVFQDYMGRLFGASRRFVIIYSTNQDEPGRYPHVRHRKFDEYIRKEFSDWNMTRKIENKYPHDSKKHLNDLTSDFYIYEKC